MSHGNLLVEDEVSSPDMFADLEVSSSSMEQTTTDDSTSSNSGSGSGSGNASGSGSSIEPVHTFPEWKGVPMDEIYKGYLMYEFEHMPPIVPSPQHTVLFVLPLANQGAPKPYPSHPVDKWNQNYVRMPSSPHSLYSNKRGINKKDDPENYQQRWEVIQDALLTMFYSSIHLEEAIFAYNHKYSERWNFKALHHFFTRVVDEDEADIFFNNLLPKIISLALQLPELITGGIPLLKRHMNASISLSQLQVASLLANAFFCTFPRRNSMNPQSEYANYPYINFSRLFSSFTDPSSSKTKVVMEKLKCLIHYFKRVTSKAPEGTITIQRKHIPKENCPKWNVQDEKLPSLHITSSGTIESEGAGLLQVDFANKYVGGGVMNYGCVQEEIRFVICPELFVTMLVTEALDDTEALVVCGVEQYSKYEGYSDNFQWSGNFVDETPRDNSGRRKTCIVAIDALFFKQPDKQFGIHNITRELNKAYVGFCMKDMPTDNLSAIATGNWGCGAFNGNPKLKVLIQLMAAALAKRSVVYFTFGNTELRDSVADMYWFLVSQNISISQLYNMLENYSTSSKSSKKHSDFYPFLYNKGKMKTIIPPKLKFDCKLKNTNPTINKNEKVETKALSKMSQEERIEVFRKMLEESDEEEINEDETLVEKENVNKIKHITESHTANETNLAKSVIVAEKENRYSKDNIECKSSTDIKEKNINNSISTELKKKMELDNNLNEMVENVQKIQKNNIEEEKKDLKSETNEVTSMKKEVANKKATQRKISDYFTPLR